MFSSVLSLWWGVCHPFQRELGESSLLTLATYCIVLKCFSALRKNRSGGRDHCSFVCSSHCEQGHFSEDSLNNMPLDSQLEWFNCFWIHMEACCVRGRKQSFGLSWPHLCSVVASKVPLSGWWKGGCTGPRSHLSCPVRCSLADRCFFLHWHFHGISSCPFFNLW